MIVNRVHPTSIILSHPDAYLAPFIYLLPCLQPLHADVIRRFFDVQYVLLAPICPHFCEHVWGTLLGHTGEASPCNEACTDMSLWRRCTVLMLPASRLFRDE